MNLMMYSYFFFIEEYDRFTEEWELVDVKDFDQLETQERVKDKENKIAYYGMWLSMADLGRLLRFTPGLLKESLACNFRSQVN